MRCPMSAAASALLLSLAAGAFAQNDPPGGKPPDPVQQELERLQAQIDEMKKKHTAEIAALRKKIEALRSEVKKPATEEAELEELRRLAEAEAEKEAPAEEKEDDTSFKIAGLSLQALNPEISVVGDAVAQYRYQDKTRDRLDFEVRTLGIHIESYLDPYSKLKAAIPVTEDFAKLGEAYFTRYALLKRVNVTFGKFRQQFGVVNRWHRHALDQLDFPLALKSIFGAGGLNQTGLSIDWSMPPIGEVAQALTLQVTNGENEQLFSGNTLSTPSVLAHYKLFHDLSRDLYVNAGLTGLVGWNEEWPVWQGSNLVTEEKSLPTWVFGADLSLLWEPADRMRYRNVEWRTECYFLHRDLLAPDTGREDTIEAWGAYTYLQSRLSRQWIVGARLDYYRPDSKGYAGLVPSMDSLVSSADDPYRWGVSPYVTWYQSPFVHLRLEYDYESGKGLDRPEHLITLQVIFAAGPHKHERY